MVKFMDMNEFLNINSVAAGVNASVKSTDAARLQTPRAGKTRVKT